MINNKKYRLVFFYHMVILILISSISIVPQDNTNNNMQEKTIVPNNILERKINQNANYYASLLQKKLDLTLSQTKYVYDILIGYYSGETGIETTQRAALRENNKSIDIETDPLMRDESDIKSDPLMQNVNNMATTRNNGDKQENASYEAITKIGNILDNGQINNWIEVKDSWWGKVNTMLSDGINNLNNKFIYEEKGGYVDDRDYENFDVYYPGYDFK
jgi:hypothetical protein